MTKQDALDILEKHSFVPGRDCTRDHPARDEIKAACALLAALGAPAPAPPKKEKPKLVKTPRQSPPPRAKAAKRKTSKE